MATIPVTVNNVRTGEVFEGRVEVHYYADGWHQTVEPFDTFEAGQQRFNEIRESRTTVYLYVGDRIFDSYDRSYDDYCVRCMIASNAPEWMQDDHDTLEAWIDEQMGDDDEEQP